MMQDINFNRSIKDALAFEENFFRSQPVFFSETFFTFLNYHLFSNIYEVLTLFVGISWSFSLLRGSSVSQETESGLYCKRPLSFSLKPNDYYCYEIKFFLLASPARLCPSFLHLFSKIFVILLNF